MIDIPILGDDGSGSSSKEEGLVSSVVSANGLLIAGIVFVLALVVGGALRLPSGAGVQVVVALELLALYLVLHELEAYSFPVFAFVGAVTTVVALSATGEPVIASILNSEPGVILVLGVLYLLYRWVRQQDSGSRRIVVRGDVQEEDQ